jgi:methylated-DNA-[protein]-cysteine S-methyltransferase
MEKLYYSIYNYKWKLLLFGTKTGVSGIQFIHNSNQSQILREVEKKYSIDLVENDNLFTPLYIMLDLYFRRKPVEFDLSLDFLDGTSFQKIVWKQLQEIPYGKVVTYGDIARMIGRPKAFRAVGHASGANPIPIVVPCHRVIAAGNKIGGYSAGLDIKRALLELEGINM